MCYTYKNDVKCHVDFASLIRIPRRTHYGLTAYVCNVSLLVGLLAGQVMMYLTFYMRY